MEVGLNLPVGVGSFELLRAGRLRYVDKTRAIGRLASVPSGRFFLTRPRRFGKSLLVSTLLSLFRHGLRDFDGLAVSSFWKDKTYDVLRLDFSQARGVGSLQDFHARAASLFQDALAEAGLPGLDPAAVKAAPFAAFSQFLASRPAGSLVVLIDEYDAPLAENRDKPALSQAILNDLAGFYADLKACESRLRFLYITGILRIPPAGLFSGLALATDIAFDSEAGALLGFTQDEIEQHFGEALNHAQEVLGLGRDALMKELARQYGGYCFEPTAGITVFSPWSVLRFLKNPALGFEPYWVETAGSPRVLRDYLQSHGIVRPEEYSARREVALADLKAVVEADRWEPLRLLTQTGCLTIQAVEAGKAVLGYPNAEVAASMARLFSAGMLNGRTLGQIGVKHLGRLLSEGRAPEVVEAFNRLFAAIDGREFPVRCASECRAIVQVALLGAGLTPPVEWQALRGGSDWELRVRNRHWFFEFQLARTEAEEAALLTQLPKRRACPQNLRQASKFG